MKIYYETELGKLYQGHVLDVLRRLPDNSIDCVFTSPPYFSLREYSTPDIIWNGDKNCKHEWTDGFTKWNRGRDGKHAGHEDLWPGGYSNGRKTSYQVCKKCGAWRGQLGLEPSLDLYLVHLWQIMDELFRILKPSGVIFWNHGDSYGGYNSRASYGGRAGYGTPREGVFKVGDVPSKCLTMQDIRFALGVIDIDYRNMVEKRALGKVITDSLNYKPLLRSRIIWYKPNAMPSCLHPNTKVFVKEDKVRQKSIKELKKGDFILSPTGWKRVLSITKTKKKAIEFQYGSAGKVICSLDHKFPVSCDNRRKNYNILRISEVKEDEHRSQRLLFKPISAFLEENIKMLDITKDASITWFAKFKNVREKFKINSPLEFARTVGDDSLKKVKDGKYWCYRSKSHDEIRIGRIKVKSLETWKKGKCDINKVYASHSTVEENRYYNLDYELGWLLGLYIAEGGFTRKYTGKVTLHKKERELADRFKKIFQDKFGHSIRREVVIRNHRDIMISSAAMYSLCKNGIFIEGTCKNKKLNMENILNTPYLFRKGIFEGAIAGDGYRRENGSITYTSASKQLRDDMALLASSLGFVYSVHDNYQYDKRTKKVYYSYTVSIPSSFQKEYIKGERIRGNFYNRRTKELIPAVYRNVFSCKTVKFVKLRDLPEMDMIDIEVEGGLFIIENGLVSHNSAKDRVRNSYELVFMFVKSRKYYFDLEEFSKLYHSYIKKQSSPSSKLFKLPEMSPIEDDWVDDGLEISEEHLESLLSPKYRGEGGHSNRQGLNRKIDSVTYKAYKDYQKPIAKFLKKHIKKEHHGILDQTFGEYRWRHWVRTDLSGASLPGVEDWKKLKEILHFDDSFDDKIYEAQKLNVPVFRSHSNPGNVLAVSTEGSSEAHFAVFPQKLAKLFMVAGCPKEVCKKCGVPREKIIKSEYVGSSAKRGGHIVGNGSVVPGNVYRIPNYTAKKELVGYSDCGCGVGFEPGIVLDPFFGRGTVGKVAEEMGLRWIGIELSEKYCEIAKEFVNVGKENARQEKLDF